MAMEDVQKRNNLYGFEFREHDKRRVEQGSRTHWNIKQLWQRNHEIINLAAKGFKNVDIAEILGITPACVSDTLNSDLGMAKLSELRQERDEDAKKTVEKIRLLTNKAIETYNQIFDDDSGEASIKLKKEVADNVLLELSGLKAPTKVQTQNVSMTLTADELEEFKKRGRQAVNEVIDVEVEDVEK